MLCKVIPKLTFYTSPLTRTFSRDINDPTADVPSISAIPPVFFLLAFLGIASPPPTSKPAVDYKAQRQ